MTTTNPVPSNDPTDLLFNAQKLDQVVSGSAQYYTDRLGVNRRTVEGISAAADVVLGGLGYAPPVTYASGISLTLTTQTVEYAGEVYAPKLANLPFTTSTWATDSAKLRLIQGVAATDLAASGGSSMIGYMPAGIGAATTTVQEKLLEVVSVRDFGAIGNGAISDVLAFQKAHDYVNSLIGGGIVEAYSPSVAWKLDSGLTWNTNKVGLRGSGLIDASGMTGGSLFYFTQSEPNVNMRPALNFSHPVEGFTIRGPGKSVATVRCFAIEDLAATQVIAGITIRDGGAYDFATIAYLGQGAFFTTFENFDFGSIDADGTGVCVFIPAALNSGERNRLIGCRFGIADLYIEQSNGNASTFVQGSSFNYAPGRMVYVGAGTVSFSGGHIESSTDADYWVYTIGSNSSFVLSDSDIIVSGEKTAYSPFYCDSSVTSGGMFLSGVKYASNSTLNLPLVGGTGRVIADRFSAYSAGTNPVIAEGANLLAYGDFESTNFSSEWALSGTTPPALSTTQAKIGAYSLRFSGVNGQNNIATCIVPCKPGQKLSLLYWAYAEAFGSGGNFYAAVSYLDKGGNNLSAPVEIMNITSNTAGWVKIRPNIAVCAPKGAVSAKINVSFFGVSTGTPFGYIDGVLINVI